MRILLLNHNLIERGTYFRARETARLFHALGHDVTFVTTGAQYYRPWVSRRPLLTCIRTANWNLLPIKGPDDGFTPVGLVQRLALTRRRFDLVMTFSHKPIDQYPAQVAQAMGAFWVADWCDLWSRPGGVMDTTQWSQPLPDYTRGWKGVLFRACRLWEESLERSAARRADAVTIISSWMRGQTRRLSVPDSRVHLYVSGADTRRVSVLDKDECRRQLGLEATGPVVGYVANYTLDNEQLQEALGHLWRERPNAMLLAAGHRFWPDSGPVHEAEQRGRVLARGYIPFREIPTILGAADVLVIPMRDTRFNWSRWPHKFGDYLAAGRPIVTTRIGDIPATIEKHHLGEVGEPTGAGLGAALVRAVDRVDEWAAMGARARGLAEGPASWEEQFAAFAAWLEGLGLPVHTRPEESGGRLFA